MEDFQVALDALQANGLMRTRRVVTGAQGPTLEVEGKTLIAFASNDYLGLAAHPAIARAAQEAIARYGVGAGASHLISGHHVEHEWLEAELAEFVRMPSALYFSSGYMANTGILPALVGRGDAVFSDALNHACLIDGARLSRADINVYQHVDLTQLEDLLRVSSANKKLVISDAVFSMDGDIAPIDALVKLCERYDAYLLLDDAHGFGVLGPHGEGSVVASGVESERILYVGTLGKAAGVAGAFVAGQAATIAWLAQRARTYVFTTASPPMLAAAVRASLRVIREETWRRDVLRRHAQTLCAASHAWPWTLSPSATAIQPVLVGSSREAMRVMQQLWDRGLWVPGIRPPTVPEGTSRLRISLSASHTDLHLSALTEAINDVASLATEFA